MTKEIPNSKSQAGSAGAFTGGGFVFSAGRGDARLARADGVGRVMGCRGPWVPYTGRSSGASEAAGVAGWVEPSAGRISNFRFDNGRGFVTVVTVCNG